MSKKVGTYLTYALVLLILLGVIGVVITFTRGGTTSFKTFYAVYEDKMLFGNEELELTAGKDLQFDVKYTFDAATKDTKKDFFVSIIPHATDENKFSYTVNGEECVWDKKLERDMSSAFGLTKTDTGFKINIPYEMNMTKCLSAMHPDSEIKVDETVDMTKVAYFAIKIVSYNEESTIILPFKIQLSAADIVITPDSIVF